MKPVESPHLCSNTKMCVRRQSDPLRSVNVALVLELQMQMTASSISPNAQLESHFKAPLFTSFHLLCCSHTHTHAPLTL